MDKLIYIAEDDANIRHLISSFLKKEGFEVEAFDNGDSLYETFTIKACDLVILDIIMPGNSGFVICSKLRDISKVPIIMLTAKDAEEDYISGITMGSDDYFTKPFSPSKLVVRIKSIFRRIDMETGANSMFPFDKKIVFSDITIYPDKLFVYCKNSQLDLTNTEFRLLTYLFENKNKAISRKDLISDIWGYGSEVETRATDDAIRRLRHKLANAKSLVSIDTVRGFGFRLSILDE